MNSASYLELAFSTLFQVFSWNSRLRIGTEQTILSRNPNPYTDNSCALTMLIAQNLANCTFFCPHGNLIHLPMESMIAFISGTMRPLWRLFPVGDWFPILRPFLNLLPQIRWISKPAMDPQQENWDYLGTILWHLSSRFSLPLCLQQKKRMNL